LKNYAGAQFDNFLLFKHPQKLDVKENAENIVNIIKISDFLDK